MRPSDAAEYAVRRHEDGEVSMISTGWGYAHLGIFDPAELSIDGWFVSEDEGL